MRKLFGLLCAVLLLSLASSGFALEPIQIGNFESAPVSGRYDNWYLDGDPATISQSATGVTVGTQSLKWVDADGAWGSRLVKPFSEYGGTVEGNIYYQALLNPGCVIVFDITAISSETTSCSLELFGNMSGHWGTFTNTSQNVIIDGTSHTYIFTITDQTRTAIQAAVAGYCNLGLMMNGSGSTTLYLDNIWIYPDGYKYNGPYGRSETQVFDANPIYADVTLHWKAAKDPNEETTGNAVNPAIVNEYVFMSATNEADPNLYYVGATGEDPGLVDPNSQYGPIVLLSDTLYAWTVVEAMDGYEQTFTVGVSTLNDVDPNNIVGPKWSFYTLSNLPVINTQPVSKRFGVNDASVQLTIGVTSATPATYQWYYSLDATRDAGDTAIAPAAGGNTNTITFTSHNKAYQAYYYCKVSNLATIGGGGTKDDVYTNVVSLVVERKVAEYKFDGNLNDSSTMLFHGTGVGSPTYVTGIGGSGSALSLDGTSQYVQIGNPADPNTFNKAFPRADLFTNITGGVGTEIGEGGGLDVGSILCWIKLDVTDVNEVSPIMFNSNSGWPHTEFFFGVGTDNTASNTVSREYIWNNSGNLSFWMDPKPVWADPFDMGGDGQWHMLAATWNTGNAKCYLDGNLLASWSASTGEFSVWDNTMTIGFDGTNYFGGAIDNLRVYNYEVTAEDIVAEAYAITGKPGCIDHAFDGSNMNVAQLGTSYCKIDLADFAEFASNWLNDGFYP